MSVQLSVLPHQIENKIHPLSVVPRPSKLLPLFLHSPWSPFFRQNLCSKPFQSKRNAYIVIFPEANTSLYFVELFRTFFVSKQLPVECLPSDLLLGVELPASTQHHRCPSVGSPDCRACPRWGRTSFPHRAQLKDNKEILQCSLAAV